FSGPGGFCTLLCMVQDVTLTLSLFLILLFV
ncbi:hypothetical protein VN97_g8146, partial [Penicillium thymicola]